MSNYLSSIKLDVRIHAMDPDLTFILVLTVWFFLYGLALREILAGIAKNRLGEAYNEKRLAIRSFAFLVIGIIVVFIYEIINFLKLAFSSQLYLLDFILLFSSLFLILLREIQRHGNKNAQSIVYPVEVSEQVQEKQVRAIFFSLLITTVAWSMLRFFNIIPGSYLTSVFITPILTGMTVITFIFWLVFLAAVKPWRDR